MKVTERNIMNAYAVSTPDEVMLLRGTEIEPDEYGLIYEVVIAESASHARSIIAEQYNLEFTTRFSIRRLTTNVDLPIGTIYVPDSRVNGDIEIGLMIHAAVLWHDLTDVAECYQWMDWYATRDC